MDWCCVSNLCQGHSIAKRIRLFTYCTMSALLFYQLFGMFVHTATHSVAQKYQN